MKKNTFSQVEEDAQLQELSEQELAEVNGGATIDDAPWCGTHGPGWHPGLPHPSVVVVVLPPDPCQL